jgi:hypothetical protein
MEQIIFKKTLYGTFIFSFLLLLIKNQLSLILLILSRIFIKNPNLPSSEDFKIMNKNVDEEKQKEHPDLRFLFIFKNKD